MAWAGIASAAVSAGLSIYQAISANKDRKAAREEWDNYDMEEIRNPYAGLDRVPMEAYNMRSEANATALATQASLAAQGGRTNIGGATDQYNRASRELYSDVEKFSAVRDMKVAMGEERKQQLTLEREQRYLEGLSGWENAANTNLNNALVATGSSLADLGTEMEDQFTKEPEPII